MKKHKGPEYQAPRDLLSEWGNETKQNHGQLPSGEFTKHQEAMFGFLMWIRSNHQHSTLHRTARDPTSLEPMWCWCGVEQGPCFRWVFTVTNKAQLAQPLHQHWFSNGMGWRLVGSWHGAGMQTCLAGVVSCSSARKGRRSRGTKQHESSRGTQPQEHRAVWGHLGAE